MQEKSVEHIEVYPSTKTFNKVDSDAIATNRSCPYCGAPAVSHWTSSDINRKVSNIEFTVLRCTHCGLLFVANPPADLSRYYTSDYHQQVHVTDDMRDPRGQYRYRLGIVRKFKTSGSLLEIGPSKGMFSWLAKLSGFDVSAIEMDADCVNFLRNQLQIPTVHSDHPENVLGGDEKQYDIICLWHSLEHIPEPWRVLEQCILHLAPDGILVVATPNPDALQARVMGSQWMHIDLPRHLHLLPIGWLVSFAQDRGLKTEMLTTSDRTSFFLGVIAWRAYTSRFASHPLLARTLGWFGTAIGCLIAPLENRKHTGAAYTAIFKRPGLV
jgi:2-polyprenyl-3-methyl-5-hydroxy-6-metoxy-1,4-benzoquinol methylase